jgi:hypothetical protein
MFSIDQTVWIVKRNYMERSYGMRLVEAEPFKIEELKVVNIEARAGFDHPLNYVIYKLAEKIGYKPEINDMNGWSGLTDEFREDEVFERFEEAVQSVIEMIDERTDELQEIKQHYLNMLEKDWLKELDKWDDEIDNAIGDLAH